jgi:hypothetical protein
VVAREKLWHKGASRARTIINMLGFVTRRTIHPPRSLNYNLPGCHEIYLKDVPVIVDMIHLVGIIGA